MNRATLFAVAFPIVVMSGWVGTLTWQQHSGTEVRLPVTGFDPRDLLSGHYLTYTVDYGMPVCPTGADLAATPTCVCLVENAETKNHEASWAGSFSERPASCAVFLNGECSYGRFQAHIERFYFPDRFQTELAVVPERSTITVVVRASGDGMVTGFAVDGVDLLEYARKHSTEP
jgi:uncharacterized membrane-anchored protein